MPQHITRSQLLDGNKKSAFSVCTGGKEGIASLRMDWPGRLDAKRFRCVDGPVFSPTITRRGLLPALTDQSIRNAHNEAGNDHLVERETHGGQSKSDRHEKSVDRENRMLDDKIPHTPELDSRRVVTAPANVVGCKSFVV